MIDRTLWRVHPGGSDTLWRDIGGIPTSSTDVDSPAATLPLVQPGPLDASGGHVAHRVDLTFTLAERTAALVVLEFSSDRGPCPDLEIVVDGTRRGVFHPQVIREDRSATGEPGPVAGPARVEIPLPASWFPPGQHALSITTVLDERAALGPSTGIIDDADHDVAYRPSEALPPARGHYGDWFGAFIRWSSIAFVALADDPVPEVSVRLRPTPLFVRTDDGAAELVDCDVAWAAGTPAPTGVVVHWDGGDIVVPDAPATRDFGMFRWRFPAASFTAPMTVAITAGDHHTTQRVAPCRRWRLHLIPHVHLDLGFTDSQGKVLELHCRNIDRALDLMDDDPAFRFSVDGSVIVQEYTRTRTPAQVRRMLGAVQRGSLGVNAFHSNMLSGVVSLDELFHATDFSNTLPRSEATSFRYANLTDVPTHVRAIPSVLANLGVDGFVGMSNHGRAATDTSDELHLRSPVRWQGPDGSEVLAHFADHYSQLRFIAGDPQAIAGAVNGLDRYLSRYERTDYLPTDLAVIGTHADNEDLADGDTAFVARWNAVFAYPEFRTSTFDEYLTSVVPLTERLPLWRSESGSFWEDGVGSAAAPFAKYRRTQPMLLAAETLGVLLAASSALVTPNRVELDRAWNDLSVAAEHTLTWARASSHPHASPVEDQLAWKTRYIDDAHRVAVDETRRHLAQLAELVGATGPGFLAWNPHAWSADLEAEIDVADGIDLLDADGVVPLEVLSSCAGMRRCRIALPGMPAHSYRFLPMTAALVTLPGGDAAPSATGLAAAISDGFDRPQDARVVTTGEWSIELDAATSLPKSLRHTATGRELLDSGAAVRLGQLIRTGETLTEQGDADQIDHPAEIHGHRRARTLSIENFRYVADPPPSRLVTESPDVHFVGYRRTFDGLRFRWAGDGAGVRRLRIDLLLRDDSAMCDLDVQFDKVACMDMEALYIAFPFAATNPVARYDRQLGWVAPAEDHGPGASNEWGAVTNTVSIDGDEGETIWTPLDAPLFTVGDVVRGRWPTHFPTDSAHVFSYVTNNYWPCNTPVSQSGPQRFSYRFSVGGRFDSSASSRSGRRARLDALISEILPLDRFRPDEEPTYSSGTLGHLGGDDRIDVHLASTTAHDGATARIVNLTDRDIDVDVRLPGSLQAAAAPASSDPLRVSLRPFGVQDVALTRR